MRAAAEPRLTVQQQSTQRGAVQRILIKGGSHLEESSRITAIVFVVNGAPALAAADIGIAMGLAGTDVAVETAGIALAGDDLGKLLDIRDLGGHTVELIRQNYGISIAVSSIGLVVGAGGALSPVLDAILHNASSVALVLNSSRLTRYQVAGH